MNQVQNSDAELATEVGKIVSGLVKGVVTKPEAVRLETRAVGQILAFKVVPDKADVCRVIGKGGKHFRALESLLSAICRTVDKESHLVVDDKDIAGPGSMARPFTLGPKKDFAQVLALLRLTFSPFLDYPDVFAMKAEEMGKTTLIEVTVDTRDYPNIYGKEVTFDYGPDGHIIGAIKNIFDGIGKNYGRIIRLAVTKA
jgi:predicted RNA-binding protein YlqC (UPF0109 family)